MKKITIKRDNACLYRSLSYLLYYHSQLTDYKKIIRNGENIKWINEKQLIDRNLYNSNDLPQLVQKTIVNWIYHNSEQYIDELGYKVFDLLIDTHYPELLSQSSLVSNKRLFRKNTLLHYKQHYSYFSGDNQIKDDRWGGTLELYAFSQIFNVSIQVYQMDNTRNYDLILQLGNNKNTIFSLLYSDYHYDCLLDVSIGSFG